jgi:hypothetical protein
MFTHLRWQNNVGEFSNTARETNEIFRTQVAGDRFGGHLFRSGTPFLNLLFAPWKLLQHYVVHV